MEKAIFRGGGFAIFFVIPKSDSKRQDKLRLVVALWVRKKTM